MISAEYIDAAYGIIGSIIGTAIGYGVLKHKVDMLISEKSSYVQKDVFEATMGPMKQSLDRLESRLNEILISLRER